MKLDIPNPTSPHNSLKDNGKKKKSSNWTESGWKLIEYKTEPRKPVCWAVPERVERVNHYAFLL